MPLAIVVGVCALVVLIRTALRARVTAWAAARLSPHARRARLQVIAWLGTWSMLAALLLLAGLVASRASGGWPALGAMAGVVVLVGYVPAATLGAPKLTRWQKDLGWRLHEAGATRDSAVAAAAVARVFSVLGLLAGVGALILITHRVA